MAETMEATAATRMGPLQRIIARRMAGERIASEEGVSLRRAVREIDWVEANKSAEEMAKCVDLSPEDFKAGLFSVTAVKACCVASNVSMPVGALGDGKFLEWLFSEEGRAAIMAWIEMIVKIIALLGPLMI